MPSITDNVFFFVQINYSALVDVRNVEQYVPDAKKAASNGVNQTSLSNDMDASENLVCNSNDNNTDDPKDSNPGIFYLFIHSCI